MANNDVFSALSKKSENNRISAVSGLTEMFGLSVNTRMTVLPISQLREKENHPFKVIEDDKFLALADSIEKLNEEVYAALEGVTKQAYYSMLYYNCYYSYNCPYRH